MSGQTIAIVAGTGNTGKWALKAALVRGMKVRLLARSPKKVDTVLTQIFPSHTPEMIEKMKEEQLVIVAGGIGDTEKLVELCTGADCVMSFLGMGPDKKPTVAPGVENIMNALSSIKAKGADAKCPARFISMSSIALSESKGQANKAWGYCITCCLPGCMLKKCFDDMQVAEDKIKQARESGTAPCGLTIARGTVLGDKKGYFRDFAERTDKPLGEANCPYAFIKCGEEKQGKKMTMNIDRQHVAEAFLDMFQDGTYDNDNVSLFSNVKCKNPKAEAASKQE
jgi:hypothetical protein